MPVQIEIHDEVVTACLVGDIDHHTAKQMREEIDAAVQRSQPKVLELNFKDVTFMDSSGIGLVMGRYRLMQTMEGEVRVTQAPSHIVKVMKLAGMDKLATFEKNK